MLKRVFLFFVLNLAAHAAPVAAANGLEPLYMVGVWYGEYQHDPFVFARFIAERRENGELIVIYRYYRDDALLSEHENVGEWELKGDRYFTRYFTLNGHAQARAQQNEYEILQYSGDELSYRSSGDDQYRDIVYRVKRVEPDFVLP
ncbi:MAG: hypothetical protein KIT73_06085 [Burkholderiales bacterium]|nr:hypothetical protein [Burkholderiales bacterium]